jgi:hypothetical protein
MARERTNLREVLQQELNPATPQPLRMKPAARDALRNALKNYKKSLPMGGDSYK